MATVVLQWCYSGVIVVLHIWYSTHVAARSTLVRSLSYGIIHTKQHVCVTAVWLNCGLIAL